MTGKAKRSNRKRPEKKPSKKKPARRRRSVAAPSENGFVSGDTPDPGPVGSKATFEGDGAEPPRRGPLSVAWGALKLGVGMVAVVGASLAIAWGVHRFALTSPRFAIQQFDVEGNQRFSDRTVARRAGVEAGQNLFAVDVDQVEQSLLADPWVRSAKATRELPHTLRIELAERRAAAIAVLGGELYLVTPGGEPFKVIDDRDPDDLPVVTGVSPRRLRLDRAREIERLAAAMEVLRHYATLPLGRVYPPQEVHLGLDGTVTLTVGSDPITIHLGTGPWRQRLMMAARVIGKIRVRGETPGIVFLDNQAHTERVVVRMR